MKLDVPYSSDNLKEQTDVKEPNDSFFKQLYTRPIFIPIHYLYQILCFFVFLGPIKLILCFISIFLWTVVHFILPKTAPFFKTPMKFKTFSHGLCRHVLRFFLLSLGIISINVDGSGNENTRVYISNHVSLCDFLIEFCITPLTMLKKSRKAGIESYFGGQIFDILRVNPKKKRMATVIANCASDPSCFPLLVFPEGCISTGDGLALFEEDAFDSEYMIQAISIQYHLFFTPRGFNSLFYNNESVILYFLRILSIPFITVNLKFHNPIHLKQDDFTPSDKSRACQLLLANELGIYAISRQLPDKVKSSYNQF